MGALVQVVAGPRQCVDVPLERRLVDPTLRRAEERDPSVVVLNSGMVLVEVVIENLTHFLLEVDLSLASISILETGPGFGAIADVEIACLAVVVSDVQSTHSPRSDLRVPDQVEHRVATGRVVGPLAVLQDGLRFVGGQLVGSHVLHVADGRERELLVDAIRSGVDPLTEGEECRMVPTGSSA